MTPDTLRELLIIGVLIGLSAIFVAAEIAFVTVRRTRRDQLAGEGRRSARRAGMSSRIPPGSWPSSSSASPSSASSPRRAAVSLTLALEHTFDDIELVAPYSEALALIIVTAVLSIVTIIFGELVARSPNSAERKNG